MQCTSKTTSPARAVSGALSTVVLLAATACGSDDDANRAARDGDGTTDGTTSELPAPEGAIGSVTGMPANPGPGTTRITPVESAGSARGAWADDLHDDPYGDAYTEVDPIDGTVIPPSPPEPPLPGTLEGEDPLAGAPPMIIVPEVPDKPVAIDIEPGAPDPTASQRQPIGTEAATESTTFATEPAEPDEP